MAWGTEMTNQEIKDIFDENLNITIEQLARIPGKTRTELMKILMGDK